MRHSRSLSALASILTLAALSVACGGSVTSGEPVGEESSALLCSVNSAPGTKCTPGGTGTTLPYASYVTTTTTDLTGTVNFLTQRGPAATTLTITSASPSSALPRPVSDAGGTSHNLIVDGLLPSTQYGFTLTVGGVFAYSSSFVTQPGPAVGVTAPSLLRAIEQITYTQLPVTLVGVDHTVTGTLHLGTNGYPGITAPDVPVTLPAGETLVVNIPITLPNPVAELKDTSATLGDVSLTTTFSYEQRAPSVPTILRTYPEFQMMGLYPGSDVLYYPPPPSCAALNTTGTITLRPAGDIDLQFAWDAESFSPNPANAVLFQVYWRGQVLAAGVYKATQSSFVYSKYTPASEFITSYTPADYTAIQDDQWANEDSIAFTCTTVPASAIP